MYIVPKIGSGTLNLESTDLAFMPLIFMTISIQIPFQPEDHKTIKNIADEIQTFEGISHPNLVKYYGVEVHKVCFLIHRFLTSTISTLNDGHVSYACHFLFRKRSHRGLTLLYKSM